MLTAGPITFYGVTSKYTKNTYNLHHSDESCDSDSAPADDTTASTTDEVTFQSTSGIDEVSQLMVSRQAVTSYSFPTRET
jgi:hypothetical protein